MTAKTLQLVNSAFYGLPTKVSSLQQAVTIIVNNTPKSFVLFEGV
jgi:HD-like signal output (HDOD) protein